MAPWAVFALSGLAVVAAGIHLSRTGDRIADLTGFGRAWVGAILVAGVTSLPELSTDFYAVRQGTPDLALGNLFGACMTNMLILSIADVLTVQVRLLTRVAINQALVGTIAIGLMALAAAGILVDPGLTLFGAGWATYLVAVGYAGGMWLLHAHRREPPFEPMHLEPITARPAAGELRRALAGFAASGIAIVVAARYLASSAAELADLLGIASGFMGLALLAFVTTLPEMVVSAASVRMGAYDLAVGNLLGSNAFNMVILFALDVTDGERSLLAGIPPTVLVGGMFAILLTSLVVLGTLVKVEPRVRLLDPGALPVTVLYGLGLYLSYLATR